METWMTSLLETMVRYIGQTVTIFTTSGGLSGSGFTGVLLCADCNNVKLLTDIGAYPACPVGSCCTGGFGGFGGYGFGGNCGCGCTGGFDGGFGNNPLGSVCVIPTQAIPAFTHNAI